MIRTNRLSSLLAGAAMLGMLATPLALEAQARRSPAPAARPAPAATPTPAPAQTARPAQGPADETAVADDAAALAIPGNVRLLGPTNPNLRTATAKVNGQIITGTDVDERLALVVSAAEAQVPAEELARLRQQVLRNLIDETLQIQAAQSQEIEIKDAQVEETYARLAAQNFNQRPAAMDAYLRRIGSSPASLKRQIKGEIAWQRLVQRNVTPFVNVAAEEVNETLQRLEAARGTEEYRIAEIYLAATPETSAQVRQSAAQIVEGLKNGGNFVAYARQYSQASTAVVGGDLGFVRLAQLPTELSEVAESMQAGQLAGPIAVPGGFSILYLVEKRQVLTADPRDAVLSLKQISIAFPAGSTQAQAEGRVAAFAQGVQQIRGCGEAEDAAQKLGATVVTNDQVRVRSLPEQLQSVLLGLQIGQVTPPFGSVEDGVRVLMLCGRDDPQAQGTPDFEQVMNQLEEDRINKRAQRYLRDLRNDAVIEYS